jgi:prephenate dehydrogenase
VTAEPEYLSDEQVNDYVTPKYDPSVRSMASELREWRDMFASECEPDLREGYRRHRAEQDELVARRKQEAAIRALHHKVPSFDEYLESEYWCDDCTTEWPCPTIRILDGEPS